MKIAAVIADWRIETRSILMVLPQPGSSIVVKEQAIPHALGMHYRIRISCPFVLAASLPELLAVSSNAALLCADHDIV